MADHNGKHLLFVSKTSGYELREADGDAPVSVRASKWTTSRSW